MPTQSIDLSAVTDATFNGTALDAINLNGVEIWTGGGIMLWDFPAGMDTTNPTGNTMSTWEYGGLGYSDRFWIHPTDRTIHVAIGPYEESTSVSPSSGTLPTQSPYARRSGVNSYGQPAVFTWRGAYAVEPLIETAGSGLVPKTVTANSNGSSVTATVYTDRVEVDGQVWMYNYNNPASSRFTSSGLPNNFDFLSGVEPA